MSQTLKLVQGDQNVVVEVVLTDKLTGNPIDLSSADLVLNYRKRGVDGSLIAVLPSTKPNGGADGKVHIPLSAACMAEAGLYEGEYQFTIGEKVQTVYETDKFRVRKQLDGED